MKNLILASLTMVIAQLASAATSGDHIFMCKVVGFDKKEIKGQCDPYKPKNTYRIPREWVTDEDPVKVNAHVKFILDDKQFEEWMAMNKMELPKGKLK